MRIKKNFLSSPEACFIDTQCFTKKNLKVKIKILHEWHALLSFKPWGSAAI